METDISFLKVMSWFVMQSEEIIMTSQHRNKQ